MLSEDCYCIISSLPLIAYVHLSEQPCAYLLESAPRLARFWAHLDQMLYLVWALLFCLL